MGKDIKKHTFEIESILGVLTVALFRSFQNRRRLPLHCLSCYARYSLEFKSSEDVTSIPRFFSSFLNGVFYSDGWYLVATEL